MLHCIVFVSYWVDDKPTKNIIFFFLHDIIVSVFGDMAMFRKFNQRFLWINFFCC